MQEHRSNPDGSDFQTRPKSSAITLPQNFTSSLSAEPMEFGGFEGLGSHSGPSGGGRPLSAAAFFQVKWWVIGVSFFLVVAIVPCVWMFVSPYYRSRSVVRVSPVVSRIVFNTEDNGMIPLYQSYLNTQVSIIRSASVLERVLDRSDVQKTSWYKKKERSLFRPPLSRMERLTDALSVRPRRKTELIDVSVTMLSSFNAQLFANAVVDEYKRYTDESFRDQDIRRNKTLRDTRTALQREIAGLIATKFRISERLGTTDPEDLRTQLSAELSVLETHHALLVRRLAMTRWELESVAPPSGAAQSTDTNDSDDKPAERVATEDTPTSENPDKPEASEEDVPAEETPPRYALDSEWRRHNLALETRRHELALVRQNYGDRHPKITAMLSEIDHAERRLNTRELQLDEERLALADVKGDQLLKMVSNRPSELADQPLVNPAMLKRSALRLEREIELLTPEIQHKRDRVAEAGEIAKDIAHYDEEIEHKREIAETLRRRITVLDLESRAPARISVASHAIQPTWPYRDRRVLLSFMAFAGAIAAGLSIGYLRIITDTKIRWAGEVRHTLQAPFLGQLPPLMGKGDLVAESNVPQMAESVRMVRTALLKRIDRSTPQVLLITSSSSRTGKTSFSYLLSRSLAGLGKRTLLVETDLRRPSLAEQIGIESKGGLAALLQGQGDDSTVTLSSGIQNFDLITAGQKLECFNPELLANGVFGDCLKRWKKKYDFVILDSPPVLPVADARILAGHADGTVMVLRSAHCRREEVIQAYADLSAAGGTLLGTVLVGAPADKRGGYYDYDGYAVAFPALEALPKTVESDKISSVESKS